MSDQITTSITVSPLVVVCHPCLPGGRPLHAPGVIVCPHGRACGDQGAPNTFGAHRLLTAALEEGEARQQALADALFAAYWARGEDVGDAEVLAAVSEAAGLSRSWAATNLAGDVRVAAVRAEERRAADRGIRAVPTFVVGEQSAMSGAQPPEALAEVVRRALARS